MIPVFITLGSNIAPEQNLPEAVRRLAAAEGLKLRGVSRVYETAPLDAQGAVNPEQAPFLNAAVLVDTDRDILDLKQHVLRAIEAEMGRVRSADKYAPRPIDLDIALYGDQVLGLIIEDPGDNHEIIFPDPDITRYAHIALPLADLDPEFRHPVSGETLGTIAARFQSTPGIRLHPLALPTSQD